MTTRTETLALAHGHYDAEHLESVKSAMTALGSPTLRAWYDAANGLYRLLEGCHRTRAAVALGLPVTLELVEWDDDPTLLCDRTDLPGLDCASTLDDICTGGIDNDQIIRAQIEIA